jgi:transcriptional regulator with GAF, ATPase, and Fis domain/tetratricopeptide (TPR) repeat protein/tRNA A-37 threonylcarbamoyl transferase component Bud32
MSRRLVADRYELLEPLGAGAAAEVFRVGDRREGTQRALKILRPEGVHDPAALAQALHHEFRLLTSLRHPHLVQVDDFGVLTGEGDERLPWFTMELVPGRPLDEALGPPSDWGALARIADAVLDALEALHGAGLVHRDVTATNILLAGSPAADPPALRLMDLGLVDRVHESAGGVVRGTPATVAPETLRGGRIDGRADLYALGCVLYRLVTGQDPFTAADPWEVLRAHLATPPTPPTHLNPEVPPSLEELILALLAKDPAARPATARLVRERLAPLSGRRLDRVPPLRTPLAPSLSGREREMGVFTEALARLGQREGSLLLVQGEAGLGRSRLLEELRLVARLEGHRAVLVRAHDAPRRPFGLAAALGEALDAPAGGRSVAAQAAALAAPLAAHPAVLLIDDTDAADASSREVLRELAAGVQRGAVPATLVLAVPTEPGGDGAFELADALLEAGGARLLRLRPLDGAATARMAASMLGRVELPPAWGEALETRTGGVPLLVEDLVRALVEAGRIGPGASLPEEPAPLLEGLGLETFRSRRWLEPRWERLGPTERRLAGALALGAGAVGFDDLATLVPEVAGQPETLDALVGLGLARRLVTTEGRVALALDPPALEPLVRERLDDADRLALHRAWAERLAGRPGAEEARARHLLAAGENGPALELLARAAQGTLASGLPREAIRLTDDGLAAARGAAAGAAVVRLRRTRAAGLAQAGLAEAAGDELERALAAARSLGDPAELAATLREAGAFRGERGELERALAALDEALALLDERGDTAGGAGVLVEMGRLLLAAGQLETGSARLESALRQSRRAGDAAREAESLVALAEAALQAGRADTAIELFRQGEAAAARAALETARQAARRGRILAHEASGRVGLALEEAEAWYEEARQAGHLEAEAEALALIGRALARSGRRSGALARLEQAMTLRRRLAQEPAVAELLAQSARITLERGQVRGARERAREALAEAEAAGAPAAAQAASSALAAVQAFLGRPEEVERLLPRPDDTGSPARQVERAERGLRLGEAHLRAGQPERARELLQEGCFVARRGGMAALEQEGLLLLIEAYLDLREDNRAVLALKRVRRAAEEGLGGEEALALARLLAAERELAQPDGDVALAQEEAELAARALSDREREDRCWRAYAALAAAGRRLGDTAGAGEAAEQAFRRLDGLLAALPDVERARWRGRSRVRGVLDQRPSPAAQTEPAAGGESGPPVTAADTDRSRDLERLLEINRALNSTLELKTQLQILMDTALDLCGAERGFVLLEEDGRSVLELARGAGSEDLSGEDRRLSRGVARQVIAEGRPLLSHDALQDARLASSRSVQALRIRSLLACPLLVRGARAGAIVLDSRRATVMFGEREERLLTQLAEQAGLALANARLVEELRERSEEVRALNERLSEQVEEQRVEILEKQSNLEVRFRFESLIGASPPMQKLYRSLEKLIPTEIPVLITGESGTGKDLVARVLHYCGPRKQERFVTINCAALTDTLLESELFGHRKGAFTGADRDRRGLFEQANGGTLFLDEIGEMPLPLQPKLLRALQFGEVRRVGEDAPRHVDVRVVAATNRDLLQRVAEGGFREDLMYRLDVGRVHLVPLRERLEDIGLLVEHFLEEMAREAEREPLRIEPAALRLFLRHEWPGNVRELHNEVLKLATFTEGPVVTELDVLENATFLERVRAARPEPEPGPAAAAAPGVGTLEEVELEQIREALRTAGGNRTKAAAMLGIDRSTLYRKLKRLGEA